jgi:hypothetical protein
MKHLLSVVIIGAMALFGAPAMAHVVQATSSLDLADLDVNDKPQFEAALKAAVKRVLQDTIAFKPTLIALTDAHVIGERLYFRVLAADEEGERTLAELTGLGDSDPDRPTRARITL